MTNKCKKVVTAYFVQINDDLTETVIGETTASNYGRAFVLFMDKRFGKHGWVPKRDYAVLSDGSACVKHQPFPPEK